MTDSRRVSDLFDQVARGGDTAKPAVDAAEIPERNRGLLRRTGIGIEDLLSADSLHACRTQPDVTTACPSDLCQFFFQQLFIVEIAVIAVAGQQFVVRAEFNDASAVQNRDAVRIANGRDAV